jgi:hypothetical protein
MLHSDDATTMAKAVIGGVVLEVIYYKEPKAKKAMVSMQV